MRLAEAESRTAGQLAPHFFTRGKGDDGEGQVHDQVALGLLAGWEVEGMVREGHFVSAVVPGAAGYRDVIQMALSRPAGREALLDPTAERVALGVTADGGQVGALISTYATFDGYRHDRDPGAVAARIAGARRDKGLPPPAVARELNAAADRAARAVQAGQLGPRDAMRKMLREVTDQLGRPATGWVGEALSLEEAKLPDPLLTAPAVTIGVGHHRPIGRPWGTFVIFYVALDAPGSVMTARRGGPGAG
jgi:hypothetical protein